MAEAVAADGAGVLLQGELLGERLVAGLDDERRVLVGLLLCELCLQLLDRRGVPVAVAVLLRLFVALRGRDQLGEHPGERVDLVASQRGARRGVRRRICKHTLEAEHQAVANLPRRARETPAGLDLRERIVEGTPPGRAGREYLGRILAVAKEWLARPRLGAVCIGGQRICRLGEDDRLNGFLHVRSTLIRAAEPQKWRGGRSLSPARP